MVLFSSKRRFLSEEKSKEILDKQLTMSYFTLKELSKHGVDHDSYLKLEFFFYSNTEEKAKLLYNDLLQIGYKVDMPHKSGKQWCITGWTDRINMSEYSVLSWIKEMCLAGFKQDCEFDGWGTYPVQEDLQAEIEEGLEPDDYFNKALDLFNSNEYLSSLQYFNKYINLMPNDAEAFYDRAVVKSALKNKKGSIADYDKAIELKPDHESALLNRGAEKDETGEYERAIQDYARVLELNPNNALAYFNQGNTKYSKGDLKGACEDWIKAKDLGEPKAADRLDKYCWERLRERNS
jgi:tetratricopeptide (TPR) repeat protein